MTRVLLYGPARAPFTEKVRRALQLKHVEFQIQEPSGPEDYQRWSPKTGLLPVLAIGDERVADSTEILLRLDELHPEPPLLSLDPRIAGQQRQLEDWADENLLWHFNKWRAMNADADARSQAEAVSPGWRPLRRLLAWLRAGGTWERPEMSITRGLGDRMDDLVGFLGTRAFFYADRISMADLGVYSMLRLMRADFIPGTARLLAARPSLVEFMRRVEEATGGP